MKSPFDDLADPVPYASPLTRGKVVWEPVLNRRALYHIDWTLTPHLKEPITYVCGGGLQLYAYDSVEAAHEDLAAAIKQLEADARRDVASTWGKLPPLNVADPIQSAAEDYRSAMQVLDDAGIPRVTAGGVLSLVGRMRLYRKQGG